MDEFNKPAFRNRTRVGECLPRVSLERLKVRVKAADQFKSHIPREMRQCACCGWRPPAPLLARNPQLYLLHAHHIIAVGRGGSDDPENLVLLCGRCHDIADYLGGRNAVAGPVRTRAELMAHLILLTTDPDAWDQQDKQRRREIQGELSRMLAEQHGD